MAISRAQLVKELEPGLNALFGLEYKQYVNEAAEIFDTETIINSPQIKWSPEQKTYFEDKNVSKIRFDTLRNEITFDRGTITIPKMTINSTLGFLEISGTQIMNERLDMDYEIGVPWKMIKNVAANKLFRRKKKDEEAEDEIQYKKENSKFVYVTVKGGIEDFKVNVGKKKRG